MSVGLCLSLSLTSAANLSLAVVYRLFFLVCVLVFLAVQIVLPPSGVVLRDGRVSIGLGDE